LAYAVFFPNAVVYIWGILPLRAPVMVLGFTALEIFSSITGFGAGVAHLTHLAGFGFGWVYFLARFSISPWKALTRR
jgi:membrane associated rhomboid family serine protease